MTGVRKVAFHQLIAMLRIQTSHRCIDDTVHKKGLRSICAEECWNKQRQMWNQFLGSHQHIPELIKGVRFIDGVIEQSADELKSSATKSPTTHTEIVA